MRDRSLRDFPRGGRSGDEKAMEGRYNTAGYYQSSLELGRARSRKDLEADDDDQYDDYNSGKQENYNARGYYGSNYGGISEHNRGRDYESNAGYRESYEHLTTGQWPEVEEAAQRRGFDLHNYELAQRGVHRGKGPRGWQRSDQRMEEDINDLLTEDPYIDATEIEVKVEKGEVVLTGVVENRNIKRRVEDLVEQVSGIKNIENRLRPRSTAGQSVNIHTADK